MNRNRTGQILQLKTRLSLLFEKITIITFALVILILLIINFYILNESSIIIPMYSYYFMNERLVFTSYIIDAYLLPVTIPDSSCDGGYDKKAFANLENFNQIKMNDITNITKIQDKLDKTALWNITFAKETYWNFNISEKLSSDSSGVENFPLINKYALNNWKGTNFCVKRVHFDEYFEGLHIIPVNRTCKDFFANRDFKNNSLMDCGTYGVPEYGAKVNNNERYFRLCVRTDQVFIDESKTTPLYETTDEDFIKLRKGVTLCPLQGLDFLFDPNPNFDDLDVNSWLNLPTYITLKNNQIVTKYGDYNMSDYNRLYSDPLVQVYPLLTLFDLAYFALNQAYPDPSDAYVFGTTDDATFNPNKEYGLTDLVCQDLDWYYFWNIYNDTFYSERVWDANTKSYSYVPDFASKSDEKNFIIPEKQASTDYLVTLNKKFLPVFSKTCFEGVFGNPEYSGFIKFFLKLNIGFLSEYILSSFTLCMMLALLAFYNEYYIRYYIIERIIDSDINEYDLKSEKYTKYTHKILEFSILFITSYYTLYNLGLINEGIKAAQLLLNNNCFVLNNPPLNADPDDFKNHINLQFIFYIDFLKRLSVMVQLFLAATLMVFIMMILVTFTYLIVNYEPERDPNLDDGQELKAIANKSE